MKFTIGCDPEFFVKKDGKFVSAYGLIGGTKKQPLKVDGGAVQVDGMALEFNINPAETLDEFKNNISRVLTNLRGMVDKEYEFAYTPVAEFGKDYIEQQPLEAKQLGCEPDFNAWDNGIANPAPDASASFRTASGHIHIGWTEDQDINDPDHIDACCMLVKQLDVVLGESSLLWDKDATRRQLYGKAGAFRPKPYGVEYRVLSNAWLTEPWIIDWVYNSTKHCFNSLLEGRQYFSKSSARKIIDENIIDSAYANVDYWYPGVPNELRALHLEQRNKKIAPYLTASTKTNDIFNIEWNAALDQIVRAPVRARPVVRPGKRVNLNVIGAGGF